MAATQAEVMSLADMTEEEFKRLYVTYNVADAPNRQKADMIDAIWEELYDIVFKPDIGEITYNNCKSKLIPYKVEEVEAVCKKFINLNRLYGGVIKLCSFSDLTGIHTYTMSLWSDANKTNGYIFSLSDSDMNSEFSNIYIINNGNGDIEYKGNNRYTLKTNSKLSSLRFDAKKKIFDAVKGSNTNGLSMDTMGHTIRANQDEEVGKMYEPRRMVQQEQIRQKVLTELPKLSLPGDYSANCTTEISQSLTDKTPES